jgi:transposase
LAQVLVNKYADFLPLYRQAQIFARQGGIELDTARPCATGSAGRARRGLLAPVPSGMDRSRCDRWWLEPLWRLLRRHVMGSTRIFADDTPLPVLDPGRGRTT